MGCCCAKGRSSDPALHKEPLIPHSALCEEEDAGSEDHADFSSSSAAVGAAVPESEPFVERFSSKRSWNSSELMSDQQNPIYKPAPNKETEPDEEAESAKETESNRKTAPGDETWPDDETPLSAGVEEDPCSDPESGKEQSAASESGPVPQGVPQPDPETVQHHPVLIAIDIDGTLLNTSHELVPSVEAAIAEARDHGVHIVIATGKGPGPWSKMLLPRLRLLEPVIMLQGLMVCDPEGREVRAMSLQPALANELLELGESMAREDAELNAFFYVSGARILCPRIDKHAHTMREYGESPPAMPPPGTTLAEHVRAEGADVYKLVCFTTPQRRSSVRERLRSCVGDRARVLDSAPCAVEVISSGVSKATAVAEVAMELGVPPENVIAIGDGDNDVEMVAEAGLGLAMGNACARLKARADRVVSANDDDPPGVVEALSLARSGLW